MGRTPIGGARPCQFCFFSRAQRDGQCKAFSQLELSLAPSQSEWRVVLPCLPFCLRFSADLAPLSSLCALETARCRMSFPEVGENAFSLELTYNYGQAAAQSRKAVGSWLCAFLADWPVSCLLFVCYLVEQASAATKWATI